MKNVSDVTTHGWVKNVYIYCLLPIRILQGLGVHMSWWGKLITPLRHFSWIRGIMNKYHLKRLQDSMNHGSVLGNGVNRHYSLEMS